MALNDIDQLLINETGRIVSDMYRTNLYRGPWGGALIKQEAWPDKMGSEISVMTYDRVLPATAMTWSAVGFNTGSGSNCAPAAQVITPAQTLRSWSLAQGALESSPLCVNDIRFSLNFEEQLANCYENLTDNTYYTWAERYRDEYTRVAQHKVIAHTAALPEDSAAFPLIPPTSTMVQGILDYVYLNLVREADKFAEAMVNSMPQFVAIMSPEVSNSIKNNTTIANNINYAYMGSQQASPLLKALGVEFAYKGFFHLIDLFAPRWNFTNGAWVRVPAYVAVATTQGNKYSVNPAYLTAGYEDTIIFVKSVMTSQVPNPIGNAGGNVTFTPQMYRGDFKWLNYTTDLNPDNAWGRFRALFMQGSKPIKPQHGWVIRHLRCNVPIGLVTCS